MMKVFSLLFLISSCYAFNGTERNIRTYAYIVEGSPISIEHVPYHATLWSDYEFLCGAVIIGERYVLTAAHCIASQSAGRLWIVAGIDQLTDKMVVHQVFKRVLHKKYDNLFDMCYLSNDIAMLWVYPNFRYSREIQPIPLAIVDPPVGAVVSTTGFGRLTKGCCSTIPSRQLMTTLLRVMDLKTCNILWKGLICPSKMCLTSLAIGTSTCVGDSGGPVVYGGELVGIISGGNPRICDAKLYPNYIESVPRQLDFIAAALSVGWYMD